MNMMEGNILYNVLTQGTVDAYNNPTRTFVGHNITGVITDLSPTEYHYVEPGFVPAHYSVLWTKDITPEVGDQVTWHQLVWEVRNSVPIVIGQNTIYYQTILRRVINKGVISAGG